MDIGDKIHQLRIANNMTLEELGNKVSVGKSTVRKWEQGIIQNMKRDKIDLLARALNCSPAYLMGWEENPEDIQTRLTEAYIKGNRVARLSKDEKVMKYAEYLMDMSEESRQLAFNFIELLLLKESQNKG